jgi:hypothetical protein
MHLLLLLLLLAFFFYAPRDCLRGCGCLILLVILGLVAAALC